MVPTEPEKVFWSLLHHGCHLFPLSLVLQVPHPRGCARQIGTVDHSSPCSSLQWSQKICSLCLLLLESCSPEVCYFLGTQPRSGSKSQVPRGSEGLSPFPTVSQFPCFQKHSPLPSITKILPFLFSMSNGFPGTGRTLNSGSLCFNFSKNYLRHRSPKSLLKMREEGYKEIKSKLTISEPLCCTEVCFSETPMFINWTGLSFWKKCLCSHKSYVWTVRPWLY